MLLAPMPLVCDTEATAGNSPWCFALLILCALLRFVVDEGLEGCEGLPVSTLSCCMRAYTIALRGLRGVFITKSRI